VNEEKDPADAKEQNEKWKLENEKESPLKKSERNVINPQKPLGPQNLNDALRENVQLNRKVAQANTSLAAKALGNKLARICYYIIRDQVPFRGELIVH